MNDVDASLRELSRLSTLRMDSDEGRRDAALRARRARADAVADMSPEGLASRLRAMASASRLCVSLSGSAVPRRG